MGFKEKLKDWNLIEDDNGGTSNKKNNTTKKENLSSNSFPHLSDTYTSTATATKSAAKNTDELNKFEEHLQDVFKKANLPGPDYYEFISMISNMGIDDNIAFPAAFKGLQSQGGLTKESLISTAKQYISIIQKDNENFNAAINDKIIGDVQNKKKNLSDAEKDIEKKKETIQKLSDEIAQQTIDISNLKSDIEIQETKATEKLSNYKIACTTKIDEINNNIEKIKTLIK